MLKKCLLGLSCLLCLGVTACSTHLSFVAHNIPALHGRTRGGQQPVSGATIQLYATGNAGDGSPSIPLLNPAVQSDGGGNFQLAGVLPCPSPDALMYMVATGGNPGLAPGTNNAAIALAAALGPCGSLTSATFIDIDEVTTVAAVNALAPFTTSYSSTSSNSVSNMGSSPYDADDMALSFTLASQFANTSTGSSPGTGLPSGVTVPTTTINTLADVLAPCVNSAGGVAGDPSPCGKLFSLVSAPGGTAPTNTFTAALFLAWSPTTNTGPLLDLITPAAPFQPVLTSAPASFSLSRVVSNGLMASPASVSFPLTAGNYSATQAVQLKNTSPNAIALSSFSFGGFSSYQYSQTNDCPASLAAGASCNLQLVFAPFYGGTNPANLVIGNDTTASLVIIGLTGNSTQAAAPAITSATPSSVARGAPSTTITLTGSGFSRYASVYTSYTQLSSTYLSPTSISFVLPASYSGGNASSIPITVENPNYYLSNVFELPILNAVPVLNTLNPAGVTAGSPDFQLSLAGTGFNSASNLMLNGVVHAFTSYDGVSGQVLISAAEVASPGSLAATVSTPGPGGGTSAPVQFKVLSTANRVQTLNYPAVDIVSDPVRPFLYAAIGPSNSNANSVVSIDPATGAVVSSYLLSAQPGRIAVSDDGSLLYVTTANTITRLKLPSLALDLTWTLNGVGSIAVAPGHPHTLAASVSAGFYGSLYVFDDNVARPTVAQGSYGGPSYDTLAWGSTASTLYATDAIFSGGPEYTFDVTLTGPNLLSVVNSAFGNFPQQLTYDRTTGLLYDGSGNAVTPATGSSTGIFQIRNTISYETLPFAIDGVHHRAYYLNVNAFQPSIVDIQAFDASTYGFLDSLAFPGLTGSKIVTLGTNMLAVAGGNQIYLIDGPFVSASGQPPSTGGYALVAPTLTSITPQSAVAGSGDTQITLTGKGFNPSAEVSFNTYPIPSTWQSSTRITATVPASLLTQTAALAVSVNNGPNTESSDSGTFIVLPDTGPNTQMTTVAVSGSDMVWDASQGLLYVAGSGASAASGNAITAIDPMAAAITNSVATASQPSVLAISGDDQFLYTGFAAKPSIQRFKLPGFTLDLTIPLTQGGPSESFAADIEVAPGQPHTIAVSMGTSKVEPRDAGGLTIFDDAVARPNSLPATYPDTYKLAWGSSPSVLYANSDPEFSPQEFSALAVDSSGITGRTYTSALGGAVGLRPHYDPVTNLIYSDAGAIANPVDGSPAGFFEVGSLTVPDPALNRAFIVSSGGTYPAQLDIYDLRRQTHLKTIPLPRLDNPLQMVRWGSQGLAILSTDELLLLQGSDISGVPTPPPGAISMNPSSVLVGSAAGATVAVNGTGFTSVSTVAVNEVERATTFVSPTQLTFQLTAADLATPQYLTVQVYSSPRGGTSSPAASLGVVNPTPTITSFLPAQIPIASFGSSATVTINGAGFLPVSSVSVGGSARTTTYIGPGQLSFQLSQQDNAALGTLQVTISNPAPGGGTSLPATLQVVNPQPVIASASPSVISAGSGPLSLYVNGTGIVAGTTFTVNGSSRPATYEQLAASVQLTSADVAAAGTLTITATNPAPGGGTSAPFVVQVRSGIPGPLSFMPNAVDQGTTTPVTVTVLGSNLTPASSIALNGYKETTYISPTKLSFVLSPTDMTYPGTLSVSVTNIGPNGGTSYGPITVVPAVTTPPTIVSVSPQSFVVGSPISSLQIYGSGFSSSAQVLWNNTPLATISGNPTFLYATVPASLLTTIGTATIIVENSTASGGSSNGVQVSIENPPVPALTSISPSNGPVQTAVTVTLNGSGFAASSVVAANGAPLQTTYVNAGQLTAEVPAGSILPGNIAFTVNTPAPGGGESTSVNFTSYIPIVNNSMIFNPANQLFYLSIPSSAGAPYGNSIITVDPVTGTLGQPLYVGSEPDLMALSSDGTTLWVALDGTSEVRQVSLATQTAGMQSALPPTQSGPVRATAMATIPGQPGSIVVATSDVSSDTAINIYDNGVPRAGVTSISGYAFNAIQVNGAQAEIYLGAGPNYMVYSYNSSGLTLKTSASQAASITQFAENTLEYVNGNNYDDFGTVLNAETGAMVGSLASSTTPSVGILAVDSALGLAFQLNSSQLYTSPSQIQIFPLSTLTAGSSSIPISYPLPNSGPNTPASRLTRWGSDGLAFHTPAYVVAVRSNLVKDLSTTSADLGVTLSGTGVNTTGSRTTYTATVSNAGPSAATEVALNGMIPASATLLSAVPSSGVCSIAPGISCNLGSLASGSAASVTLVVEQTTAGTSTLTVTVSASENDPNVANNQASSTATITGSTYLPVPALTTLSPAVILAGSTDTLVTLSGSGFVDQTVVLLDGSPLPTNVVSASELTVTVPAASLAALDWHRMSVTNPAPGGGASSVLPLSVYTALPAAASHIVYEPFSRTLVTTLNSTTPLGNAITQLTPETGSFTTPVAIGSEPTRMALSDDGQMLYVLDSGDNQIVRFNLPAGQAQGTVATNEPASGVFFTVQPGTENTLAMPLGQAGIGLVDFDPVTHLATARSSASGLQANNLPQFLDASTLVLAGTALQNDAQLTRYTVSPSGLSPGLSTTFSGDFYDFRLAGGLAFSSAGLVGDLQSQAPQELGSFPIQFPVTGLAFWPDPALGQAYFIEEQSPLNQTLGINIYDANTFTLRTSLPLNIMTIPFSQDSNFASQDVVRWGQDGLAAVTNYGTIYLIRGGAVLPQLLEASAAPVLASGAPVSLQHGSGNTTLTLTGSNFLPGIAATWNGSYRTTVLVDANHIVIDIPASDLRQAGSAVVTAANPDSPGSGSATITIN